MFLRRFVLLLKTDMAREIINLRYAQSFYIKAKFGVGLY